MKRTPMPKPGWVASTWPRILNFVSAVRTRISTPDCRGEWGWHFDVATALADIGQGAAIGDAGTETVDFRSEFAGETMLSAAVAGIGDQEGIF